jgi:aminoglycoside phosphotransferase (APT) family kinase protein
MALDADLTPVVDAMPGWAGREVRAEALEGGITNRNFRVDVDGETFVVRLSGKDTGLLGIDRDAERRAAQSAHEAGVAPEVIAFLPDHSALVTRFVRGDPLPPADLERPEVMAEVVESIGRIHGMRTLPSTFDVFRIVRVYRETAEEHGVRIPVAFTDSLTVADRIADAFAVRPLPARPCHNDLLNANFLVVDGRVMIVDYEYAGMGDLFFDLGNFSINNGISEEAQERLLRLYFGAVRPAARARLKLMRILSDFREAMWAVVQQGISTLEFDYVGYADRHFSRCLESAGNERFGAWLADAKGER